MRYLPLTDTDRKDMLATIGAASIDALFADVPKAARRDGLVDTADEKILMGNLGQSHLGWSDGDFNGDGKVGLEDLQTLELGWFGADVQAPVSAVPASAAALSSSRRLNPVLKPQANRPHLIISAK